MKLKVICLLSLCHGLLMFLTVKAFPKRIPLGVLFDARSTVTYAILKHETDKYNNDSLSAFKIDTHESLIDVTNNHQLTKTICSTMSKGVFAMVGGAESSSVAPIVAFSNKFHMPYVTLGAPYHHQARSDDDDNFVLHVRPSYVQALTDVIKLYQWTQLLYVYDSDEGLSRLNVVLGLFKDNSKRAVDALRLVDTNNSYDVLRSFDSGYEPIKCIVLDLSTQDSLQRVLKQLQHLGMNRANYRYLLGGLAMDDIDLSDFSHGGANVTGFRLIDPRNESAQAAQRTWLKLSRNYRGGAGSLDKLQLDVGLAMDAMAVISRAFGQLLKTDQDVFRNTFRRGELYNNGTRGIQCKTTTPTPWVHGHLIATSLQQVKIQGVTGLVTFGKDGLRSGFSLDVFELDQNRELKKIGVWTDKQGLILRRRTLAETIAKLKELNRTKIITTIVSLPMMDYHTHRDDGEALYANDRFEGYCAELAKELSEMMNFTYEFRLVEDKQYGKEIEQDVWNGMVGELINHKADLAIAPLTISKERERVIDFSTPFMDLGISIMIKKPEKQKPGVFSFMDPISEEVWMCLMVAYLGVSFSLFLVSRFSPYEWQIEDGANGPTFANDFTIFNSLWFSLAPLLQQGIELSPRSVSGRIVGSAWWFFTLIVISSYTATLAAYLTIERMSTPIDSADALARQTEIHYGTLANGSTLTFFEDSKHPVYAEMWNFMKSTTPSVFAKETIDGVRRVQNSKGKNQYAFLLESTMNDYYNQRKPCNTMKVGPNLDSKGYGVATPLHSPLREDINLNIIKLTESGFLQKLFKKWWNDKGECPSEGDSKGGAPQSALTLSNVAGVFYILIGGLGLSMFVSLLEFLCKSKMDSLGQQRSPASAHALDSGKLTSSSFHYTPGQAFGGYSYTAPSTMSYYDDLPDANNHTDV